MFKFIREKLVQALERRKRADERHSISFWILKIEIGNFLVAISTTGMMALGILPMSISILITLAILFMIIGVIGRYIDSVEDDIERLIKYEEHLNQNSSSGVPDSNSTNSL